MPLEQVSFRWRNDDGDLSPPGAEEFYGPWPSWADAQQEYGVVANGVADATAGLQEALDDLGVVAGMAVLYLPPGTYRLTSTLTLANRINVAIVGADPATTTLLWDGPADAPMLTIDGVAYSRVQRLTFDGQGVAGPGVNQSRQSSSFGHFDTGNEYRDCVFQDLDMGIAGGAAGHGFAETTVKRCRFLTCVTAGIFLGNQNALDLWVWDCYFYNGWWGITNWANNVGSGAYRVYNSVFEQSGGSDLFMVMTDLVSARGCTSLNSFRFFDAHPSLNPANCSLTNNTILDPVDDVAIEIENQGPVFLADNVIRSRTGATAPIVTIVRNNLTDMIAIDNTFTVASPISADHRLFESGTTVVSLSSLSSLALPALPATPSQHTRTPFEVAAGANAATIQAAINSAVSAGNRAVVHLPAGSYNLGSTSLTIPANSDIRLVGDTFATQLGWTSGSSARLSITGPTQVWIQDILLDANGAVGILANTLDQATAQVALQQVQLRNGSAQQLLVDALNNTLVECRDFGMSGVGVTVPLGVRVIGGASPAGGQTQIVSAGTSDQEQSVRVESGGILLVRDMWYEAAAEEGWLNLTNRSGTLTVDNVRVITLHNQATPAFVLNGFTGDATFLLVHMRDRLVISGNGTNTTVLALGSLGISNSNDVPEWFLNTASPAGDCRRIQGRKQVNDDPGGAGSVDMSNIGSVSAPFILDMVAHTRASQPLDMTERAAGVSDLRLLRVWVQDGTSNIHLMGAP